MIDPDGEHLTIVDDRGHALTDEQTLLSLLTLVCGHLLGDTVALPVTVTRHAEAIAAQHNVRVRRTKLSTPALMDAAVGARGGVRGQHRRWLHPPGVPAGLRRGGLLGEAPRAARPVGHAAVDRSSKGCPAPTSPTRPW